MLQSIIAPAAASVTVTPAPAHRPPPAPSLARRSRYRRKASYSAGARYRASSTACTFRQRLRGADEVPATERARLFRTAWDMVGSALGGRVELYERFYLASAPRNYSLAHMMAQRMGSSNAVEAFWAATDEITAGYDLARRA